MRWGGGLVVAALTVVTGLAGPAVAAPGDAPGDYTSWSMAGDYDDFVLQGQRYDYDASSGMTLEGTAAGITGEVDGWTIEVDPAAGGTLQAGRTYDGAVRAVEAADDQPGLELQGNGRGCGHLMGRFTFGELTFDASGALSSAVLTVEQHCGSFQTAAAYASIAWHASQPAPALPPTRQAPPVSPTLKMRVVPRRAAFGDQVTVQAVLGGGPTTDRELSVLRRLDGGADQLLTRGTVDGQSRLTFTARATENLTFTVRWDGDANFAAQQASATVTVSPRLRSAVLGHSVRRDRVHLFRVTQDIVVAGRLRPAHPDDCLRFRFQVHTANYWGHDLRTQCIRLDEHSVAAVRLPGDRRLIGVPIRVRPQWRGDERNPRANGEWQYVEFVR